MSIIAAQLDFTPGGSLGLIVPVSGFSRWVAAIAEASSTPPLKGLQQADTLTNGIVRSVADITDNLKIFFTRENTLVLGPGTTIRARVVYPVTTEMSGLVFPVVRLFGGRELSSVAQISYAPIRNLNGDLSVELPINPATDTRTLVPYPEQNQDPSTYCATIPDNHAHSWDCDGNTHFVFAVERGIAVPNKHLAVLEVKIV